MSAPRLFPPLLPALLVTFVALLAAGCTIPGSSRLEGPPKDLPPSLDLVTADVLGFWLVDTDPGSKLWDPLEGVAAEGDHNAVLARLHTSTFGSDADTSDWIGDAAGIAIREFDIDGTTESAHFYFADVRSRDDLEEALEEAGWSRDGEPGRRPKIGDDTPWTGDVDPELPAPAEVGELWLRTRSDDGYSAAAVTDTGIVAARTPRALRSLLRSADEYAVPERRAMREFAVDAAKRSPAAFVFRADLLRTQVRRPFGDDPALLEFARWATDSNVLIALRDGWIGIAPAIDEQRREQAVRIVGSAEWVPDLAPDITLAPADLDLLGEVVGPDTVVAVALHDPGQHIRELVRAITLGAGQYVTEQDVPDGEERVELQPLLDDLDGDAAIGFGGGELRAVVEDPDGDLGASVERVLRHAGVDATTTRPGTATSVVTVPIGAAGRPEHSNRDVMFVSAATHGNVSAAGKPPRAPIAWLWSRGVGCVGETVGWVTFDGTDRLTFGLDAQLHGARSADDDQFSLLATCASSIAAADPPAQR